MKSSAKKAPAAVKTVAKPAKPAAKAPAKKAAAAPAKKLTAEPPDTFISALIDIGFGNHLYIRGEGPGLSWDHGLAMDNTSSNLWTFAVKGATTPITFKVLVNDLSWSAGPDYVAKPGKSLTVTPTF
ncbi:MAG TPA: hypothetical protein VG734_00280 [Lacunisphaera sp.]|nr:hypothetical protein [Lacunisphaera sp.]